MGRNFTESSDQNSTDGDVHVEEVFDVDPTDPYDAIESIWQYLSQETRHDIIQLIIGHPDHLVSVTEFDYYLPKSRSTISDQLNDLADHRILEKYHYQQNEGQRDLPADFWGPTEFGVRLLSEYNYLHGLPILRAIHDATQKSETAQRHETAPRPELPELVKKVFDYSEPDELDYSNLVSKGLERPIYADAAPTDPSTLNKDIEDGRSLDELF